VANTPVLFRLPAIQNAPTPDLAATFSESAASLPTATLAAVALPSAQPTATSTERANEGSLAPQAAQQRTWWEHWSSGIVLIVLLIALATASILAMQGSNKGNSKLMADTKKDSDSQSDLSTIEVPKLELPNLKAPKLELPVSTSSNLSADELETSIFPNNILDRKSADDSDSSLIPNGPLSLTFDGPATTEVKSNSTAEPEPHATASLQSPVVKQQEPLFKDDAFVPAKSSISAQPASNPQQRNAAKVEKPSVRDSSNTSLLESNKPLTLELGTDSSSASNSVAESAELTNKSANSTSATLIGQSTADTPATSSAIKLVPRDMQYARMTSTPEMDQAAYFALYRQFAQTQTPAPSAKTENRYGTATTANSQNQAGTATGIAATTMGLTQQPTVPPNPQSALSPAQQYQNPQIQNQQYYSLQNQALPQYSPQYQAGIQYPNNTQTQGLTNQGLTNQGLTNQGLTNPGSTNPGSTNPVQQYGGAQVPYTVQQTASQSSALQLPQGPIGGYGNGASPAGTQFSTSGSTLHNPPNGGTTNFGTSNSLSYPSLQ
jgi:hypothetical protein